MECEVFTVSIRQASYGCEFVTQAVPGSTHAFSKSFIWINGRLGGGLDCYNYLRIEGPENVSAYAH